MATEDATQLLRKTTTKLANLPLENDKREELSDRLEELRGKATGYRTDDGYVTRLEQSLTTAHAIRTGSKPPGDDAVTEVGQLSEVHGVEGVNWQEMPLCGCNSPTCAAKRGELPRSCRDPSNGLLDPRSPIERVEDYVESHNSPHAIAVIQRGYIDGYQRLFAQAKALYQDTHALHMELNTRQGRQWSEM